MITKQLEELQKNMSDFLQQNNLEHLQNPFKSLFQKGLKDLNFVSFEEFEIQKKVLERLQQKVQQLEQRVQELEQQDVAK